MSRRDRDRFEAQIADLARIEQDASASTKVSRQVVAEANDGRREAGRPPLDEHPVPPEAGLYARARALGLRRISG